MGTKKGYVHAWANTEAKYIGEHSLTTTKNFIVVQKEDDTDTMNVNYVRDFTCDMIADIALAQEGHYTEEGTSRLIRKKRY